MVADRQRPRRHSRDAGRCELGQRFGAGWAEWSHCRKFSPLQHLCYFLCQTAVAFS